MSFTESYRTLHHRDQVRMLFYDSHLTPRTTQSYLIPHYEAAVTVGLYASSEQIPDHFKFSFAKLTALTRYEHYRHTGNVVSDADTPFTTPWIESNYLEMTIQAQEPIKWPAQALLVNTLTLEPARVSRNLQNLHRRYDQVTNEFRSMFGLPTIEADIQRLRDFDPERVDEFVASVLGRGISSTPMGPSETDLNTTSLPIVPTENDFAKNTAENAIEVLQEEIISSFTL